MQSGLGIQPRLWRRLGRAAFSFAALLALALQAFAVQTHVHAFGPSGAAGIERSDEPAALQHIEAQAPHERPACALCAVLASAGAVTLPAAHAIFASHHAPRAAPALATADAPRSPNYSWRSRAPPIAL